MIWDKIITHISHNNNNNNKSTIPNKLNKNLSYNKLNNHQKSSQPNK